MKGLVKEAAHRAEVVLKANKDSLDKLAQALLKEETLEEEAVVKVLKDATLPEAAKLHE